MADAREHVLDGSRGSIVVREWPSRGRPRYLALVVHGYGEHVGRYAEVADVLVRHGAAVFGPDHVGHGRSAGERVVIEDFEDVVADLHAVAGLGRAAHPDVPVVMVGHSMGGLIAARYAQLHGDGLAALALSGPVIGDWELPRRLLALDEIPDTPISPASLSRDPAVGAAYVADPLVWHGPMKRPTVEAFARMLDTVSKGGDLETCRCCGSTATTTGWSRSRVAASASRNCAGASRQATPGTPTANASIRKPGTRCSTRRTRRTSSRT